MPSTSTVFERKKTTLQLKNKTCFKCRIAVPLNGVLPVTSIATHSLPFHLPQKQCAPCPSTQYMNTDVLSQPVHGVTQVPCCCTVSKLYQGCLLCSKSQCGITAVVTLNLTPHPSQLTQIEERAGSIYSIYHLFALTWCIFAYSVSVDSMEDS